ncbi:hypothetical protein ACWDA7_39995 [Streptomyces sp. NPDC001156]
MADTETQTLAWVERMECLRESTRERVLTAPMPTQSMDRLLGEGKAVRLGSFEGAPIHYLDRWWRESGDSWEALDERATAEIDSQAERYRAAVAATEGGGARARAEGLHQPDTLPSGEPGTGEA